MGNSLSTPVEDPNVISLAEHESKMSDLRRHLHLQLKGLQQAEIAARKDAVNAKIELDRANMKVEKYEATPKPPITFLQYENLKRGMKEVVEENQGLKRDAERYETRVRALREKKNDEKEVIADYEGKLEELTGVKEDLGSVAEAYEVVVDSLMNEKADLEQLVKKKAAEVLNLVKEKWELEMLTNKQVDELKTLAKEKAAAQKLADRHAKTIEKMSAAELEASKTQEKDPLDKDVAEALTNIFNVRLKAWVRRCFSDMDNTTIEDILSKNITPDPADFLSVFSIKGFFTPTSIAETLGSTAFFDILLSGTLVRQFFQNAFWMCRGELGYQLKRLEQPLDSIDPEATMKWRAMVIRVLEQVDNEREESGSSYPITADIDFTCKQWLDDVKTIMTEFLNASPNVSGEDVSLLLSELTEIVLDCMELSLDLGKRTLKYKVVYRDFVEEIFEELVWDAGRYGAFAEVSGPRVAGAPDGDGEGERIVGVVTPGFMRMSTGGKLVAEGVVWTKVAVCLLPFDMVVESQSAIVTG
ncbi:hypothetical protein ABW19_dt0203513 [Dactylella cylindrospora]|nr:hypothetical protein ABW19_dt0203513 [Dactylella cylindrospora]